MRSIAGTRKEGKTPKRVSVPFQGSRIAPFCAIWELNTGGLCVSAPDPRPCILSKEPPQWPGIPQAGCGRNLSSYYREYGELAHSKCFGRKVRLTRSL